MQKNERFAQTRQPPQKNESNRVNESNMQIKNDRFAQTRMLPTTAMADARSRLGPPEAPGGPPEKSLLINLIKKNSLLETKTELFA